MKITHATLIATTALGFSMSAAYAGSGNKLFLDQDGTGNVANVHQSSGAGGNEIGTSGNHGLQQGDNNNLRYNNAGSGSGANNDIWNVRQIGNNNDMGFSDWNGAFNNVTNDAQQNGNNNLLRATHNGGDDNLLDVVRVDGDRNDITIDQSGKNGIIQNVHIVGSDNGNNGSHVNDQNWGVHIRQGGGSGNIIRDATITGDNNVNLAPYGYYNGNIVGTSGAAIRIRQSGNANDANATMWGSGGNVIYVNQTGDTNIGGVNQGSSLASTGNAAVLIQTGNDNDGTIAQSDSYNIAHATQLGTGNFIAANQVGDSNSLMATFIGDRNGVGVMTGVAGTLEGSNVNLSQGNILQDSSLAASGNLITYDVTGNDNLFAFAQIGGSNTINGTVTSNGNQVAVLQVGSGHGTSFTQAGGINNNLAVSQ